jgi:S-DNA-T family DNA segregation ATPase FtsK/SpoIIIE
MRYLTEVNQIQAQIAQLSTAQILWLDTEVADWWTRQPRLSLIQVSANPEDLTGESVYIFDVLDQPDLVTQFINQIMLNSNIEKVFHNASYDLGFLGRNQANYVTCTLKLARQIGKKALAVSNLKLKTLAAELCHFSDVDAEPQTSDWGQRALTPQQLTYAAMDVVYLAAVHRRLLDILNLDFPNQVNPSLLIPSQFAMANSESLSFSATKVRIALECPRLFYLYQNFGSRSLFIPPNAAAGIGSAFHRLADELIQLLGRDATLQKLFEALPEQLQVEEIATRLQQHFYQFVFSAYLQKVAQTNQDQAAELLRVWQGLQHLIQRFAELLILNRQYCQPETLIQSTFIVTDRNIAHQFQLPNGMEQRVAGEFDCLVYNFQLQRLAVIEFKTYQPADPSAQLAQVALYSYMLWVQRQAPVDAAVYCVLPEFSEYHYSWEQLESTVHQLIPYKLQQMQEWLNWQPGQPAPPPPTAQPHLCEMCSQYQKCQTFFTETNLAETAEPELVEPSQSLTLANLPESGSPEPFVVASVEPEAPKTAVQKPETQKPEVQKPATQKLETQKLEIQKLKQSRLQKPKSIAENIIVNVEKQIAADRLAEQLVNTLQAFNVDVECQGFVTAPAFIRVKLKPNLGVKVSSILKLSNDLRVQLGLAHPPLIAPQAGYVSVDLPRPDRQSAQFDHYVQAQTLPPTAATQIAIGVNLEGKLIEADLSDPNTCHFLVGGTTGSGKSEFLRSVLLSLLKRYSATHLKIALVDPKRVTFPEFEHLPWLYQPIVKEGERAIELMESLVREMESRYQTFEVNGCSDLSSYNHKHSQAPEKILPRIVCIFDEYADFMAEKEIAKGLELSIKRLGAMARAAGIHLIIATQRPEAKIVTPVIRSNLPGRIALRTASEADSMIILGGKHTEAAYLLGKGDLLYQIGANSLRLQSLFAPQINLKMGT